MSDQPKNGDNGAAAKNGNGSSGTTKAIEAPEGKSAPRIVEIGGKGGAFYMQQLINTERPARMVGLFTMRQMKPHEVERLVGVCLQAMKEEDQGASLTLAPLGDPAPQEMELQRTWRVTITEYTDAQPHDCLVQLFDMNDPGSTHRALLDHLFNMDEELGQQGIDATQGAQTYLTIASGKLVDQNTIHPFQNLVALFSSALGACIVDPAGAVVTMDAGEWAEALEMSLQLERDMHLLRK
jgi:hypothetical protein